MVGNRKWKQRQWVAEVGGGAGGGNLTFTPQTNPPVTKTLRQCSAGLSALAPKPPKTCCLQFPYSCCKGEKWVGGVVRGNKEDTKVLFHMKETREGRKQGRMEEREGGSRGGGEGHVGD